ncbi:MAG: hypothetical protein WEA80_06730 [Gemmatimonadaceae bacterium]
MSDAALFIALFGGLFVIRLIAATVVFLWILPDGDRCPCCDAETLRVESRGALKAMPWFRSSWCYECDWHGLHRVRRTTCLPFPAASVNDQAGSLSNHQARRTRAA